MPVIVREGLVGVKDGALFIDGDGAGVHGLDDVAIRVVRPFEGIDPAPLFTGDDHRIDFAFADRLYGLLPPLQGVFAALPRR